MDSGYVVDSQESTLEQIYDIEEEIAGAEEDIDDEHDQEEDAKGDAEVEEPDRRDPTALADV